MIRPFLALAALSAIAAAPAVAPVLQLAKETATVENAEGEPLFVIRDLAYLAETYGSALGRARVTGYCIRFGALRSIDLAVLEAAIRDGIARTSA